MEEDGVMAEHSTGTGQPSQRRYPPELREVAVLANHDERDHEIGPAPADILHLAATRSDPAPVRVVGLAAGSTAKETKVERVHSPFLGAQAQTRQLREASQQ